VPLDGPVALGLFLVMQVPLEACLLALFLRVLAGALPPRFLLRTFALFAPAFLVLSAYKGVDLSIYLRIASEGAV
jgi:hypothetical protein